MRFQKYPFSSRRKRSKTFSSTLAFLCRFHPSTLKRPKTMKRLRPGIGIAHVLAILHFGLEPMARDAFYVAVSKSLRFHLSILETERFQTSPLLKPFSKVSGLFGVFGRFSVDDRRKRMRFQTKTHYSGWGLRVRCLISFNFGNLTLL